MFDEEEESLRPYPIDPFQDQIIEKIVFAKRRILPRITLFIFYLLTFPISIFTFIRNQQKTIDDGQDKSGEEIDPIYVNTRTECLDSKFYYAVRDGRIWFKPIAANQNSPWKLFGGNGFIDNTKTPLISLSADGDNILAVDRNNVIHYAKSNLVVCQVSFDCSQWKIIESKVKWTEKWFNMDGVSLIVNLFKNPILKSLENSRSIAMSHKGHETMYYTDRKGKKHPDPYVGVTTIYCLNDDGTRIYFADPWLQNKFGNELTTPVDGQFKAETLAASGSTIFLIQRAKDEQGKEINEMFTRFADFDSIGSNPALKSTYNLRNSIPLIRILPAEDWIKQPSIILHDKARLTKNISILQLGWGQNNRQLRVQGQNHLGFNGFYFKNIYQTKWKFQMTDEIQIDEEQFLSSSIHQFGFERGPQICFDYVNGSLEPLNISSPQNIILEKFAHRGLNERGLHTKLIVILTNGFKCSMGLYARRGWKSLFGISNENIWKLVIPLEYFGQEDFHLKEFLEKIFLNRSRHSVHVHQTKDHIQISNVLLTRLKFRFTFKNKSL